MIGGSSHEESFAKIIKKIGPVWDAHTGIDRPSHEADCGDPPVDEPLSRRVMWLEQPVIANVADQQSECRNSQYLRQSQVPRAVEYNDQRRIASVANIPQSGFWLFQSSGYICP